MICPECEWGYYFVEECFTCEGRCFDIHYQCLECSSANVCTDCGNQLIPEADGSSCIAKFDHCKNAPIDSQPSTLATNMYGLYECDECESGFFRVDGRCKQCPFSNCADCDEQ